ncbi:MAG TPA: 2-dehydro-3-deoxygalactonokinase [Chitinophagaceae bacterium]|nr:2-dehydro-3-deoxygalactonokinase [Chitinophagaceae bacterium]
MQKFISCDWGTTSFRLRLVDPENLSVIGQSVSKHGIAMVHNLWKQNGADESNRIQFYKRFIADKILAIQNETGIDLTEIRVIISGMASSSIGMMELPCVDLPVSADGSDLLTKKIAADSELPNDLILVSGIKTENDIARGEETQLAGCEYSFNGEMTYIFPGTHSKHIVVQNGRAVGFKTYMTGEFLHLLSEKSILSYSVEQQIETDLHALEAGVTASQQENLLHNVFKVRTNDLFGRFNKNENYDYLKGLLIGVELRHLRGKIQLVADAPISSDYAAALTFLNLDFTFTSAETATIRGQQKILFTLKA